MYQQSPGGSVLKYLLVPYHFFIIAVFSIIYGMMGLKEHFGVTSPTKIMPLYYSTVTHTGTGYGDISPKTDAGRFAVVVHLCLAWIPTVAAVLL